MIRPCRDISAQIKKDFAAKHPKVEFSRPKPVNRQLKQMKALALKKAELKAKKDTKPATPATQPHEADPFELVRFFVARREYFRFGDHLTTPDEFAHAVQPDDVVHVMRKVDDARTALLRLDYEMAAQALVHAAQEEVKHPGSHSALAAYATQDPNVLARSLKQQFTSRAQVLSILPARLISHYMRENLIPDLPARIHKTYEHIKERLEKELLPAIQKAGYTAKEAWNMIKSDSTKELINAMLPEEPSQPPGPPPGPPGPPGGKKGDDFDPKKHNWQRFLKSLANDADRKLALSLGSTDVSIVRPAMMLLLAEPKLTDPDKFKSGYPFAQFPYPQLDLSYPLQLASDKLWKEVQEVTKDVHRVLLTAAQMQAVEALLGRIKIVE